ncbi:hypothetical protein P3W55_14665 [Pseudomonas citronellolis]|uniref:Uncharacterized protein n=1 Tax=Pseudomonas citronellolis TaxID=53408 RepID=A0AAW6P9E7_9PSED|nr:hypothetical protein [Pseudomonas citronellolis]MDF3842951.1 hypothetical protein [Pseudomonas citronellolis]
MQSKNLFGLRRLVVCGCLLIGAQAVQAGLSPVDRNAEVQQIRSLSYSVVVNALLYYNQNGSPYEQDNARVGKQSLERLLELTGRDFPGPVHSCAEQLAQAVQELRHLPQSAAEVRSVSVPYSPWLPHVVELQARLDGLLSQRPDTANQASSMRAVSHDIERLLLSYEIASFANLGADIWILDDRTMAQLDASIVERLTGLSSQYPDLVSVQRDYQFVRRDLLNPTGHWTPTGVNRYLARAVSALNSRAESLNRPSGA